jgi:hypothetical protein
VVEASIASILLSLAKEAEQNLRPLIGNTKGLDTKLLTRLQRRQSRTFPGQIRIHEGAKT